ncbi:MAG: efflux RND transporter periplasmic adaptor subunit [bacterium]
MKIRQTKIVFLAMVCLLCMGIIAGCGNKQPQQGEQAVAVKAMQVIQKDTPITYVYAGEVKAKEEVNLQARVSGSIVAKMVEGGDVVRKGQPLFKIDSRSYQSAVLSNQAQLAQAQANLKNAELDAQRYNALASQDAIAKQTRDTQNSVVKQQRAVVAANQALLKKAQDDLNDTVVVSPIDGKIDINDLSVGSYVTAGDTIMATISSVNPVYVQFNMSENEYLSLNERGKGNFTSWGKGLKLVLSDGSVYAETGSITQVDRGLSDNTGTLTMKATFNNPNKILIPGMFGRIEMTTEVRKGALLIPQRAVQQVLSEQFVTVIGKDNKAETRSVTMGTKIGNLWVVEKGLKPSDVVVVEGLTKLQPGISLKPTMIGLDDLNNSSKK